MTAATSSGPSRSTIARASRLAVSAANPYGIIWATAARELAAVQEADSRSRQDPGRPLRRFATFAIAALPIHFPFSIADFHYPFPLPIHHFHYPLPISLPLPDCPFPDCRCTLPAIGSRGRRIAANPGGSI